MKLASIFLATITVILGVPQNVMCATNYVMDLERLEPFDGILIDFSKVRVIRNKNREYCVNGTFEVMEDIDQKTIISVDSYFSPRGNGQFIKSSFAVPPKPACDFLNTSFEKYIQPSLLGLSNLPIFGAEAESVCPLPKGVYFVKCALVKEDNMITHIPRGLWKVDIQIAQSDVQVAGVKVFVKVSDKIE